MQVSTTLHFKGNKKNIIFFGKKKSLINQYRDKHYI